MKYGYENSKILMLTNGKQILIDGTTQTMKQRLYSLRNYYRNYAIMKEFLRECQIFIIEPYPCKSRFDLEERIKFFVMKINKLVNKDESIIENGNMLKTLQKRAEEAICFTIYFD